MSGPDNPPAFPIIAQFDVHATGMTLLDYFAAAALNRATRDIWAEHKPEDVAGRCYMLAEAMLSEREKRSKP